MSSFFTVFTSLFKGARFFLLFGIALFGFACSDSRPVESQRAYESIRGETMGTYYHINLENIDRIVNKQMVDSLLIDLNNELSTYIPDSYISRFNQSSDTVFFFHVHSGMAINLLAAVEVSKLTHGAFDPTVMPLVNYWGFGYSHRDAVLKADSMLVDSLMKFVGYEKLNISDYSEDSIKVTKSVPGVQLDFSAIAKGFGTDLVANLLRRKGIQNYMVDIGGEVVTRGVNRQGSRWRLGINTPDPEASTRDIELILLLESTSMASSGNYRNIHVTEAGFYAHTINPASGFPELSNILSATIVAENAMLADAYATAVMVLGYPKAKNMIESLDGVEALFILGGDTSAHYNLFFTEGMQSKILEL